MIAKIGRGSNLYGALAYNQLKVASEKGQILSTNKMIETPHGQYSVAQLTQSFEPYLVANRRTEKPVLHISLNPNLKDNVSNEKFRQMAQQYMEEMGYGQQPFVVFKHMDISRTHIHIVSVCVDETGKKISDKFEKRRSMKVCRELESKFNLIPATEKQRKQENTVFRPVDSQKSDVKSQIASVVRHLPQYYQFQTLGEYNTLLSLFNITAEKVERELHGKMRQGLVYIPLNEKGEKAGHPLKASLFGKKAGLPALELHFEKCKATLKNSGTKSTIKLSINDVMASSSGEQSFKRQLVNMGISVVVRRNDSGRIYGITFIDHNSKTLWNGSRLGKGFSANVFNDCWNHRIQSETKKPKEPQLKISRSDRLEDLPAEKPQVLFDFLYQDTPIFSANGASIIESLGGLLPETQGEDYEELDFANRMKRKKKKRRRKQ